MAFVPRLTSILIAAAAWTGLAIQFALLHAHNSALLSLWIMAAYFTILTNVVVAIVFTGIALNLGTFRAEWLIAGVMLSILLVGVVNALLLWGALENSGGSAVVDKLLHVITPTLVTLYWIFFVRKGTLTARHPVLWSIFPLAYLAYALLRGSLTGQYAYPFLNAASLGWPRVTINAAAITLGYLAAAYFVVWLDHRFTRST
jgi:hypothetical protein